MSNKYKPRASGFLSVWKISETYDYDPKTCVQSKHSFEIGFYIFFYKFNLNEIIVNISAIFINILDKFKYFINLLRSSWFFPKYF
jgi:hypothetical protein